MNEKTEEKKNYEQPMTLTQFIASRPSLTVEEAMKLAPDEIIVHSIRVCGCDLCCEAAARRIESYVMLTNVLATEVKFLDEHLTKIKDENFFLSEHHKRLVSRLCGTTGIAPPPEVTVANDG